MQAESLRTCVADGAHPGILGWIEQPEVEGAIWRRGVWPLLRTGLRASDGPHGAGGRVCGRLRHIEALADFLAGSMDGDFRHPTALASDIADLGRTFAALARIDVMDIRLEIVRDNACRSFHRDRTPMRLVTTYHGPGTQLVSAAHAAAAMRQREAYRGPMIELPPGAVAVIRGDPEACGRGMVHRSPPIEGSGRARVFLCVDYPSAASPPLLA